jgi:hypothetical protein
VAAAAVLSSVDALDAQHLTAPATVAAPAAAVASPSAVIATPAAAVAAPAAASHGLALCLCLGLCLATAAAPSTTTHCRRDQQQVQAGYIRLAGCRLQGEGTT